MSKIYEIYGKKVTLGDEAQEKYNRVFEEDPPIFVVRSEIGSWGRHSFWSDKKDVSLEDLVGTHTEKELSEMLNNAILDEMKEVYGI